MEGDLKNLSFTGVTSKPIFQAVITDLINYRECVCRLLSKKNRMLGTLLIAACVRIQYPLGTGKANE